MTAKLLIAISFSFKLFYVNMLSVNMLSLNISTECLLIPAPHWATMMEEMNKIYVELDSFLQFTQFGPCSSGPDMLRQFFTGLSEVFLSITECNIPVGTSSCSPRSWKPLAALQESCSPPRQHTAKHDAFMAFLPTCPWVPVAAEGSAPLLVINVTEDERSFQTKSGAVMSVRID